MCIAEFISDLLTIYTGNVINFSNNLHIAVLIIDWIIQLYIKAIKDATRNGIKYATHLPC